MRPPREVETDPRGYRVETFVTSDLVLACEVAAELDLVAPLPCGNHGEDWVELRSGGGVVIRRVCESCSQDITEPRLRYGSIPEPT